MLPIIMLITHAEPLICKQATPTKSHYYANIIHTIQFVKSSPISVQLKSA